MNRKMEPARPNGWPRSLNSHFPVYRYQTIPEIFNSNIIKFCHPKVTLDGESYENKDESMAPCPFVGCIPIRMPEKQSKTIRRRFRFYF